MIQTPYPSRPLIIAQDIFNLTDVRVFLDDLMVQQKYEHHFFGAHICIVKEGMIYFSNGYGSFENRSGLVPVLANTTLFRVGSLSKAVTATAIMQLVERDLIDLDVDVNDYLKVFKVPATFNKPITIAHLLSHTSGLRNTLAPIYLNTGENLPTLEEVLSTELPNRIIPPGQAAMYSNFGYALLGYIIELISGMTFQDYVRSEIFEPLEMNNSYFEQELPEEAVEQISGGYHYNPQRGYILKAPEFATIPPAAGLITTAEDYGKFLIAHLNNGTYDGRRILRNETVQLMHDVHFEARPGMDGVCYGFYERDMNDLEMIGHGGITYQFHATEVMLLDKNIGLYVCYNTDSAAAAGAELVEAFLDRFYPGSQGITPLEGHEERVDRYTGEYVNSHAYLSPAQKMEFLTGLSFEYMRVTANQGGTLRVQRIRAPSSQIIYDNVFIEVELGLFLDESGESKDIVAFLENENGVITHMYFSWFPPEAWVRGSFPISVVESLSILQIVAFAGLFYFPLFIIVELLSLRKYQQEETRFTKVVRLLSVGGVSVALLTLFLPTTFLLLVAVVLTLLLAIVLLEGFRRKSEIDNLCSVTRFVSALQFSLVIPALLLLDEGSSLWRSTTNVLGEPASWFEIQTNYHSTMTLVFVLLAVYLIAIVAFALLVVFSWTKRGGLNRASLASISERVLYTGLLVPTIIVVWVLSQWGAFVFVL